MYGQNHFITFVRGVAKVRAKDDCSGRRAKLACVETKSDGRKKLGRKDAQGVLPSFQAMPFSAPAKIHHPRAHNANTATNTTARLVKSASLHHPILR